MFFIPVKVPYKKIYDLADRSGLKTKESFGPILESGKIFGSGWIGIEVELDTRVMMAATICREASVVENIDPIPCLKSFRQELQKSQWKDFPKEANALIGRYCRTSRPALLHQIQSDRIPEDADLIYEAACKNQFDKEMDEYFEIKNHLREVYSETQQALVKEEVCRGAKDYVARDCVERFFNSPELFGVFGKDVGIGNIASLCRAPDAYSNVTCFIEAVKVLPEKDELGVARAANALILCERGKDLFPVECFKRATKIKKLSTVYTVQNLCLGAKGPEIFNHPKLK